jgi:5-methylcytosine-specific restriction protein B
LVYAGSPETSGACISRYFSPEDLSSPDLNVLAEYIAAVSLFAPLFERAYRDAPNEEQINPTATDDQRALRFAEENAPAPLNRQSAPPAPPAYTIEDALAGLFLPREQFEAMLTALSRKKNIIVQGPPGVGKTLAARRLASVLMRQEDTDRLEMIQFHQSYAYEDFVQGWRPTSGGFELREGVFYRFCESARREEGAAVPRPWIFLIDEINRGNVSKIFGDLLMLIEADKRSARYAQRLAYAESGSDRFWVPQNVYIIGMMNTADRSLALIDYALRRRFIFFELRPQFDNPAFRDLLADAGVPELLAERIITRMLLVNEEIIGDEKNLGRGFAIGHSYFCPGESEDGLAEDQWDGWYRAVVENEVIPLLDEYWFDNPQKAQQMRDILLT